jgi:hypothetical protein
MIKFWLKCTLSRCRTKQKEQRCSVATLACHASVASVAYCDLRHRPLPVARDSDRTAQVLQARIPAMTNSDGSGVLELTEDNFTFDVPDDALERAASVAEGKITTWAYCTQAWYNCGWPL